MNYENCVCVHDFHFELSVISQISLQVQRCSVFFLFFPSSSKYLNTALNPNML